MSSNINLIDLLEREWADLQDAPSTGRGLRRWGSEDAALAFAEMKDLVAHVEHRGSPEETDEVLPALVRRAAGDELAARTVLQLLLPGCKALAGRYCLMGDVDEVVSMVVSTVYERIRAYRPADGPVRRGWIAADILMATRQQRWSRARWMRTEQRHSDETPARHLVDEVAGDEVTAGKELIELLAWAVGRSPPQRRAAPLIGTTRIGGAAVAGLSAPRSRG